MKFQFKKNIMLVILMTSSLSLSGCDTELSQGTTVFAIIGGLAVLQCAKSISNNKEKKKKNKNKKKNIDNFIQAKAVTLIENSVPGLFDEIRDDSCPHNNEYKYVRIISKNRCVQIIGTINPKDLITVLSVLTSINEVRNIIDCSTYINSQGINITSEEIQSIIHAVDTKIKNIKVVISKQNNQIDIYVFASHINNESVETLEQLKQHIKTAILAKIDQSYDRSHIYVFIHNAYVRRELVS
jgi:gas vesicle protein